MSYRNLEINGRTWRFKVGESFVDIRGPENEKFVAKKHEVKRVSADEYNGTGTVATNEDGPRMIKAIGPGYVKNFIERKTAYGC